MVRLDDPTPLTLRDRLIEDEEPVRFTEDGLHFEFDPTPVPDGDDVTADSPIEVSVSFHEDNIAESTFSLHSTLSEYSIAGQVEDVLEEFTEDITPSYFDLCEINAASIGWDGHLTDYEIEYETTIFLRDLLEPEPESPSGETPDPVETVTPAGTSLDVESELNDDPVRGVNWFA